MLHFITELADLMVDLGMKGIWEESRYQPGVYNSFSSISRRNESILIVLHKAEGSHLTQCAALIMLKEGEFITQEKSCKDVCIAEHLGEETGKALLVWLGQMKTEKTISLSKSVWH